MSFRSGLPLRANLRYFTLWNIPLRSSSLGNIPLGSHRLRPWRRLNLSFDARRGFTLGRREIALRACLLGIILGTAWLSLLRDRPDPGWPYEGRGRLRLAGAQLLHLRGVQRTAWSG